MLWGLGGAMHISLREMVIPIHIIIASDIGMGIPIIGGSPYPCYTGLIMKFYTSIKAGKFGGDLNLVVCATNAKANNFLLHAYA